MPDAGAAGCAVGSPVAGDRAGDDAARPEGCSARVRRRRPCAHAGRARSGAGRAGVPARAMKTGLLDAREEAAPIVQVAETPQPLAGGEADSAQLERARAFAEPLLAGPAAEPAANPPAHADGVAPTLTV